MNYIQQPWSGVLAILAIFLLSAAFVFTNSQTIDDIRMCAVTNQMDLCPTDNPVFAKGATNISINVRSAQWRPGDEVRFTWYRVDDSEFFSTYLDAVFETVTAASVKDGQAVVQSSFPTGFDVSPGMYEVVVHGPRELERPVIKSFKVLD